MDKEMTNAIQLSIISVVFCHRKPLFLCLKTLKILQKQLTSKPIYVAQALIINIFQGGSLWLIFSYLI